MHRLGPIDIADYHVAGAPFRVVTSGAPELKGGSALERLEHAQVFGDDVRRFLVNEPRGHTGLGGGYVIVPGDSGADLGVVFFHQGGYSTVSGSGLIAVVTWAIESGIITGDGSERRVTVATPAGLIEATAFVEAGRVGSVSYTAGAGYVAGRFIPVQLSDGVVSADIAYGGAYFAMVDARELGLAVTTENLELFVQLGREIGAILGENAAVVHPTDHRLSGLAGSVFYEEMDGTGRGERSVTLATDGRVHRSPCGGATSARLALLDSSAALARGERLTNESIVGGRFTGRVVGDGSVGGIHGVVTEVQGRAYRIGGGTLWLEADDPMGYGYQLR